MTTRVLGKTDGRGVFRPLDTLEEEAEGITFRGASVGNVLDPNDPVDPLYEYLTAEWFMVGDKEYPPWYYHALGKFKPNPADVERIREELAGIPRLDVEDIDLLFNGMIRCWEIVKWVAEPGGQTFIPGLGWVTTVIRMPVDIYTIEPFGRSPATLGERDFAWMRRNCITLRDPGEISAESRAYNEEMARDRERRRQDAEYDAALYFHAGIRREAEESGLDRATPEELAKLLGGEPWMYDPDYELGG